MLKYSVIIILILSFNFGALAQKGKKIRLVQADEAVYDKTLGEDVQRILGNAVFEHEGALMYCDSAHLNNSNNSMKAFSRVHIKSSDTLHLYGDSIYYNGDTKVAQVFDNVKLIDNQTTLTTDKLIFDRNTGVASYTTGGHIVNEDNTLDSKRGYYHTNSKDFFFRIDVILINPEYTIKCDTLEYNTQSKIARFKGPTNIIGEETDIYAENGWYNTDTDISEFNENARVRNGNQILTGDSLYYERKNGFGEAFRNIRVIDTVQNVIVYGQYARYDRSLGFTNITINPEAHLIDNNDTLFLHSEIIKATFDSEQKTKDILAYNHMKFYKSNMQGMSDSLAYSYSDSTLKMYFNPVLWTEANQLTGDSIHVRISKGNIDKMYLYNSAFLISKDSSGYNQVKGRNMVGTFIENELVLLNVLGNSETIYWVREEDGTLTGINKASASNMDLSFKNRKARKITYLEKPTGGLYPQNDFSPAELILRDFIWYDEARPKDRYDIFRW